MKEKSNIEEPQKRFSPAKSILTGAVIGLILISLFIFEVDKAKAEWGTFWKARPLIVEPIAGAIGGLFFYFMNYMGFKRRCEQNNGCCFRNRCIYHGALAGNCCGTAWNNVELNRFNMQKFKRPFDS